MEIDKTSTKPYYEQIMLMIKSQIGQGLLKPGAQLPSVREMARQLLMNPNTVSKAYKLLETQHVIVTVKGRGTYVAKTQQPRDPVQVKALQQKLADLVTEATYLGISKAQLIDWLMRDDERSNTYAKDSKFE